MLDMCVDPNTGIYRFGDYVYGEYGMLLCIVNRCQILWEKQGDNNNVHTDQQYSKLVQSSVNNQLVFVHNHPGGGGLSWKDLKNLIQTDQIQAAVVITNHGRTFIMGKTSRFNSYNALNKYYELTRNRQISDQDRVSEFLKQLYSMGLEYMTN